MKLIDRHESITAQLSGLPDDEAALLERWAIRVATIAPVPADIALPTVMRFRAAGGDERIFQALERHVCKTGCSFIQLLSVVSDLIPLGVVK